MTNEEAIVLLEDQMNFNRTMQRGWGNSMIETDAGKIVNGELYANQHKDVADALELAINALRAGGADKNVNTMPAGQPLTLEQLQDVPHGKIKDSTLQSICDRANEIAYPPAHVDLEAWEPCEYCNGKTTLYQHTNSTKLFINTFGAAATLVTECIACPPYADCCMKDISANSAFRIKFCPECGRPLTEAAWAELENLGVRYLDEETEE